MSKCTQVFGNCSAESSSTAAASSSSSSCGKCCILSSLCGGGATEMRLLVVGIDGAGKTVLYNRATTGTDAAFTSNTIGFNVETVAFPSAGSSDSLALWDMGGLAVIRPKWKEYYAGVDGIVFVIDAANKARLEESLGELKTICGVADLAHAPILIAANKQDDAAAMSVEAIAEAVKPILGDKRKYLVQGTIAKGTGEGVHDGLEWLYKTLKAAGAGVKKGSKKGLVMAAAVVVVAAVAVAAGVFLQQQKDQQKQ